MMKTVVLIINFVEMIVFFSSSGFFNELEVQENRISLKWKTFVTF